MTLERRNLGSAAPLAPRPAPSQGAIIAQAALVITLGNILSRFLGLVRETVISDFFGASGLVSGFRLASIVPTMVYDLLIGGMISASLVPVFSEYAAKEREELGRVAGTVFTLFTLGLLLIVLVLEFVAPAIAALLGSGFSLPLLAVTTDLTRIVLPSILFFGLSGISAGLLYARQRFIYPAFGAAIFNLGVILAAIFLASSLGIYALVWGIVLGAFLQLAIQLPGLRGLGLNFGRLYHPALRRIALLYLPVLLGVVISNFGILIDRNLASRTGENSIAWMATATTLIQLPLGLMVAAVSTAVLPSLSQFVASREEDRFRLTLATGLRMVFLLILPAAAGLLVLGPQIIDLIFEHGAFTPLDTRMTSAALSLYLIGLPFAAIDTILIFAFYARGDTRTPVLVGIFAVGVYLITALLTITPLGFLGLVLANSLQWMSHALAMLFLAQRQLRAISDQGLAMALGKILLSAGLMAVVAYALGQWLLGFGWDGFFPEAILVALAGGVGLAVYIAAILAMRLPEIGLFWELIARLLQRPSEVSMLGGSGKEGV